MGLTAIKYKQTEVGLIPLDWDCVKMGDVGSTIIGLTYSPKDIADYGTLVLRSSNIQSNQLAYENNVFVDMDLPQRVIVKEDDILICVRNGSKKLIGKCALIDKKAEGYAFGAFMSIYRSEFSKYIYYSFQSHIIQRQIDETLGATINQLTNRDLFEFKIPLPQEPEQKVIAQVLSDTDALIQALEKKIAKKKLIKKGMMQELLAPKEDWEVKSFGEVCDIQKGQLITSDTKIDGAIPVIAGGKKHAYFHNKPNRTGKTITISASGANAGYVSFHNYEIFASDCSTISESKSYSIEYIYFVLLRMQDAIYKMQTGGAQPHIHPCDINPIEFPFPSLQEQKQIAIILKDIDSEISQLNQKLTKYQLAKQGMIQQLLTGKIRLV